MVFCSDFFPWHVWRKKVDLWFWVFPQVAEVGKTEKNIILRLRQRRSLKKCFSQFFLLRELGEKLKIRGQLFFWRNVSGKKIRTECFFQFLQYFRDSSYPCNNVLRKDRIKHFKNFQIFFWNMLRIFWFIKQIRNIRTNIFCTVLFISYENSSCIWNDSALKIPRAPLKIACRRPTIFQ